MSNKLPANSLYLHDLFAECAEILFPGCTSNEGTVKNGKNMVELKPTEDDLCEEKLPVGISNLNLDCDDILNVDNLINKMRNFPEAPHTQNLIKMKVEEMLQDGREDEAAKLLVLSQATTFHHQVLSQYSRKLDKQLKEKISTDVDPVEKDLFDEDETLEEKQRRLMLFESFSSSDVAGMISRLPPSWTVIQISSRINPGTRFKTTKKDLSSSGGNTGLNIVRMRSQEPVTVYTVPAPDSENCLTFLREFQDILAENSLVNNAVEGRDKGKYWKIRGQLDDRMKVLVKSMENQWLGGAKTALLGKLVNEKEEARVSRALSDIYSDFGLVLTARQQALLETAAGGTVHLTPALLHALLAPVLATVDDTTDRTVHEITRRLVKLAKGSATTSPDPDMPTAASPRHPVLLILDPDIQSLPWESLPCLSACHQPVSRVPSLPFLNCLWSTHQCDKSSVVTAGVANDNVFYLLNPDRSLPKTEERLNKAFQEFSSWEGVAGQEPAPGQLAQAISSKDAFVYCGHGSGAKYLSGDDVEKLRVRAVPLLLGCSSGQLTRLGRLVDPLGTAQSYLVAASPAMLGFLWPVTDADTDQWTVQFLSHWLSGGEPDLMQAAANKRESFRQFLNSAALVVYGLPLRTFSQTA